MKRYRDFKLYCNDVQSSTELLDMIEQASIEKSYKTTRHSSFANRDTLIVYIKVEGLPYSRIVLCAQSDEDSVSVVNIVPMPESGESHRKPETYNKLLDSFASDVLKPLSDSNGNEIKTNNEDYSIEEVIPQSFRKLDRWLSAYPLSTHQFDTNRWYDFVICLHETGESLSLDSFGKYLKERCGWDEDDINRIELRLESHLDLLEYYDNNRIH